MRASLHEAKYHGSSAAFALLATVLEQYLEAESGSLVLVPVPLGRARLREHGFNQVEEIAQRAAAGKNLQVAASLLVRTRETASQVSLPRKEREENMHSAFGAARNLTPFEQRDTLNIVLDDVLTTGATLQAALDALKAAGTRHVSALALAL